MAIFKKWCKFILGLFILAFGTGITIWVGLGTSPVTCPPVVLGEILPFSVGSLTTGMHILFILIQLILLRKKVGFGIVFQLPAAILFGIFIDISLYFLMMIPLNIYIIKLILTIIAQPIIALGIYIEVNSQATMLAGEGLVTAISQTSGAEFSKVKVITDVGFVAIAVIISLIFVGGIVGVREGTIISAFGVGPCIKFIEERFKDGK